MKLHALWLSLLLLGCGFALATCGTSDGGALPVIDSGAGGGDVAMSRGDMAGAPEDAAMAMGDGAPCYGGPKATCAACLKANCDAEVTACFGPMWQTGDAPSSVCSGVFACTCTCMSKGGMACEPTCVMQRGAVCQACFTKASACAASRCAQQCQ